MRVTAEEERAVGTELETMSVSIAATPLARLVGIGAVPAGHALMIVPCRDVHTVGLRDPIDGAFVDGEGTVVAAYRDVGPARRLRDGRAVAVVERRHADGAAWFSCGDRIALGCSGPRTCEEEGGGKR